MRITQETKRKPWQLYPRPTKASQFKATVRNYKPKRPITLAKIRTADDDR